MEQRDLAVLSRFEEVWRRVQHGKEDPMECGCGDIEAVMDGLCKQWKGCCQLAACTGGKEKICLATLSRRCKELFRTLQLHYYLETGDIYCADASLHFASFTLYNLRKLWQITVENGKRLKKCNLNGDLHLVADFPSMEAELQYQKTELEGLIKGLLQ